MCWKMFILSVATGFSLAAAPAGDEELDRATLRGLKAINVVIDHVDPQLPKEGVAASALQERIESRLRDANIEITESATEFVGLQISAVRGNKGPYALSFTIGLYQPVL